MLTSSSMLLLVCPLFFLVMALRKRDESFSEAKRPFVLLAYALPALVLVLYSLIWRLDATRVLLELRAVAFRSLSGAPVSKPISEREPGRGRIVIGDVPKESESGRAPLLGTLVFRPRPRNAGALTIELPPSETRGGLIATTEDGILGAEALSNGDQICIGPSCWTYDEEAASFSSNGTTVSIPPRQARIPGTERTFTLPWASPLNARMRTWSLEWLAARGAASSAAAADRVRSFLCYADPEHRLRLVLLDRNVSILRGGKPVSVPTVANVKNGTRLSLFSLPRMTETFDAPGIAERRSIVYHAGSRSYVLELDTPEIRSLTVAELRSLGLGSDAEREKQLTVSLAMGNAQMTDRSLYLSGISESVALQASSLFELPPLFPRNLGSTYRVVSPRGPADAALGETVWIGATDLAAIRFNVVRPPLLLLLIGLLLAVLKYISAVRAGLTVHQILFAGVLECIVGIRLLIGYRVWAMPPHRLEPLDLALIAWMTLPWLFLAASVTLEAAGQQTRTMRSIAASSWMPPAAGLLLSLAFSYRVLEGRLLLVWICVHGLAVAVALLRPRVVQERLQTIGTTIPRIPAAVAKFVHPLREQQMAGLVAAAVMICAARLLLLLAGYKEALIGTGGRISLSAVHIPAAVIVEGIFFFRVWRQAQRNGLSGLHLGIGFSLLLLLWGIPGLATSDLGLALLNVPVFALLLVMLHRQTPLRAERLRKSTFVLRGLVWAPVAAVCVVVVLAPLGRFLLPFVASEETMLSLASDANYARFLHFAEPERLRELATKRGESLAITSAILQSYIDSGLFGRGYGATEVTPLLGDTALRDFAPAVFVAAEWGFVGTTALLVIYAIFLILGMQAAPWSDSRGTVANAIESVAATTIAVSSIYMILANHELLLLTGKNAYLFGLDSAGDLVEFVFLLFLIACGAAGRQAIPERSSGLFRGPR